MLPAELPFVVGYRESLTFWSDGGITFHTRSGMMIFVPPPRQLVVDTTEANVTKQTGLETEDSDG